MARKRPKRPRPLQLALALPANGQTPDGAPDRRAPGAAEARLALRLASQLCFPLYSSTNGMIRAYRPHLEPLGLTYPQYLVMLVLWESSPLSVGEIGARLDLDSGTLTPLLKRLEATGLLARRRDGDDERVVRAHLTPRGRRLAARAQGIPAALLCRLGLSIAEVRRIRADLARLRTALANAANDSRTD